MSATISFVRLPKNAKFEDIFPNFGILDLEKYEDVYPKFYGLPSPKVALQEMKKTFNLLVESCMQREDYFFHEVSQMLQEKELIFHEISVGNWNDIVINLNTVG